ncbi:hypothetical protein BDN72DRAFT_777191 [Pluteus cervinus]|uniref:Uncharacterized protein n=1 Tax=Pluteus cervinus TaxID=181527 RepID=A0ACD3A9D5_9AGAR|nr:hypothetical protein BDN72DRAFT_777191 [Pluteus cervinus]
MLFLLLIASAYKAYALPTPLGPEVFSTTPFTLLYACSTPCDCGPQDRTLNDIVRSCVLTIFACIYTALHPNIPDPEAKMWQKICGRLKMSFYMLIAPEAVIWWAMRQWYGAREVARVVNKEKPELKWTTTHGHFVQMGGLETIHLDGHREVINPEKLDCDFGAEYLKNGRIDTNELQFPKNQVEDRSKGDFLSKGLVALQTSWFVLECISRFQQHLPITELEVVTLAFAVLNIITYAFWWDKPLNINCQVQIHLKPEASPDGSEMNVNGSLDSEGGGNQVEEEDRPVPEAGNGVTEGGGNRAGGPGQPSTMPMGHDQGNGGATTTTDRRKQKRSSSLGKQLLHLPRWVYNRLVVRPFIALVLPIQDMFRCERVKEGARHVPMFYACDIAGKDLLRIRLMSCIIGMIFAGIHFVAWNSHFPTHVELLLWRSSSIIVLVIPFLVGLLGILLVKAIRWALYVLGPILYVLARVSLIIQALISLRDLEPGAFHNVVWTSGIPHL